MTQLLNHAQPGDIITAEDWNLAVDAINQLLQAGQTTGIKIAASLPAGSAIDPIRIGLLVQITGQNFGFAIGQSKVIFEFPNNQLVTVVRGDMLTGSSDERLMFIMPPVPGISAEGLTATMRVNNGIASDSRSVTVKPVIIPLLGEVFVNFRGDTSPNPNPNPIVVSQAASFAYRFQSAINMPAAFDLTAEIPTATVAIPPGLVDTIEFRDEGDAVVQNKRLDLGNNETRNLTVRIPQVPSTFNNQKFTLRVGATSDNVVGTDQREFPVGTPVVETDPAIEMQQSTHTVFDVTTGTVDSNLNNGRLEGGSSVLLKVGKRMHIPFNVSLKQAGTYTITILPKQGTTLTNWTLALVNTPTTINASSNDQPRVFTFSVEPLSGAAASGSFVFRVKRTGVTTEWSKEFSVELLT
jgi:hypothetical protein